MIKIESGLFTGTEIPDNQVVTLTDDNNQPLFKADGNLIQYWPAMYRTPIFLTKFSPLDGWGIEIEHKQSPFQFQSRFPSRDGSIVVQPTIYLTATLTKDGKTIAQASSLATIEGPKSFEAAESIVRGRLYDALGLSYPRYQEIDTPASEPRKTATVTPISAPAKAPAPAEPSETTASEPVSEATPPQAEAPAQVAGSIERNLMSQITLQCNKKGIEVPILANNDEAKKFLTDLLRKKA